MGIGGRAAIHDAIRQTYLLQMPDVCRNRPSCCTALVMKGHCSSRWPPLRGNGVLNVAEDVGDDRR